MLGRQPWLLQLLVLSPGALGWRRLVFDRGLWDKNPANESVWNTTQIEYKWPAKPAIRWALSPDFCSEMQPRILETNSTTWLTDFLGFSYGIDFASCKRIHAAIKQAFDVWQANTPAVHFVDVTARCTAEQLWQPVPEKYCDKSPLCKQWTDNNVEISGSDCSFATCFECERADVVVGAFTEPRGLALGDHLDSRVFRREFVACTGEADCISKTLGTHGAPTEAMGIKVGTNVPTAAQDTPDNTGMHLQFNVNISFSDGAGSSFEPMCWRLDNDLCLWLSHISTADTLEGITAVFFTVVAILACSCLCGCLYMAQQLANNLLAGWDTDGDGKVELQEVMYVLDEFCGELCFECRCPNIHSKKMDALSGVLGVLETLTQLNVAKTLVIVALMVALPITWVFHLKECWSCRDFRATVAHEVGHLLSLDHPNGWGSAVLAYAPELTAEELRNMTNVSACPLRGVVQMPNPGYPASSLMAELRTRTGYDLGVPATLRCLQKDDLDGLNYLYPACVNMLRTPICPVQDAGGGFGRASALRVLQTYSLLVLIPAGFFIGLKVLAVFGLWLEGQFVLWKLKKKAKKIVDTTKNEQVARKRTSLVGRLRTPSIRPPSRSKSSKPTTPQLGDA